MRISDWSSDVCSSDLFRINARDTGQFERTLIICEERGQVSYLEGCTAPMRDENQLHAAVVELVALEDANIKYSTVQNWYPGDENRSEEHTSELQSLMRISYAVFCLKKKKINETNRRYTQPIITLTYHT